MLRRGKAGREERSAKEIVNNFVLIQKIKKLQKKFLFIYSKYLSVT